MMDVVAVVETCLRSVFIISNYVIFISKYFGQFYYYYYYYYYYEYYY